MGTLAEKLRSGLLELSTETGPLYASPSISERIYLLWTFRNFRRLPQQVLNFRQRQLIDKLCRASTPGQHRPAVTLPIIGTVENVHPVSQRKPVVAASASKVVEIAKPSADAALARAVGLEGTSVRVRTQAHDGSVKAPFDLRTIDVKVLTPHSADHHRTKKTNRGLVQPGVSGSRAHRWQGLVAALGAALLLGLIYFGKARPIALSVDEGQTHSTPRPLTSDSVVEQTKPPLAPERMQEPSEAHPVGQLQTPAIPIRLAAAISAAVQPPSSTAMQPPVPASKSNPAPPAMEDVSTNSPQPSPTPGESVGHPTAITSIQDDSIPGAAGIAREVVPVTMNPDPPDRVVIAAAPQSFSYPAPPKATLTGKVNLKVIISADGAVREVRVLSGNRVLADAAVRAVRRWRYRPAELNGHAAEAETNVTINFVGDDAVTIAYAYR